MAYQDLDYKKLPSQVDVAYKPFGGEVGLDADAKAEIIATTDGDAKIKKGADAIDAALGVAPQLATVTISSLAVTTGDVTSYPTVTITAKASTKPGLSKSVTTDGVKSLKQLFSTRSWEHTHPDIVPDADQQIDAVPPANPTGDGDGALLNHCRRRNLGYI